MAEISSASDSKNEQDTTEQSEQPTTVNEQTADAGSSSPADDTYKSDQDQKTQADAVDDLAAKQQEEDRTDVNDDRSNRGSDHPDLTPSGQEALSKLAELQSEIKDGNISPEDAMHVNPSNIPNTAYETRNTEADNVDVANTAYLPQEDKNVQAYGYKGEPKLAEVDFTYATHLDPNRQVDPHGVYLDDVERVKAEISRARIEGREPDLENPPATVSNQVLPTHVARGLTPGDAATPVSFSEEISVGVNDENVSGDAEAQAYRDQESRSN